MAMVCVGEDEDHKEHKPARVCLFLSPKSPWRPRGKEKKEGSRETTGDLSNAAGLS